jgi:hypothetical protein
VPVQLFDSQDAIPEEHRAAALETKDGKFAAFIDTDVSGLKSALEKERTARKDAEKAANALAAAARDADLKDKGLLETKQKWDEEILKPIAAERDALSQKVRTLSLEIPLKTQLAARLVDENAVEAVWRLESEKFDLAEGDKPVLKNNPTQDVAQYLDGLKGVYPWAFKGTQASGGGAGGGKPAPTRTVSMGDTKAFLANLDGIAKGEVAVQ